jgi:aryl-alcohol dehydrogenase-like predicted oxidoreductase
MLGELCDFRRINTIIYPRVKHSKSLFALNRLFENASEICYRENVGLLAYSPMGFGVYLVNFNG